MRRLRPEALGLHARLDLVTIGTAAVAFGLIVLSYDRGGYGLASRAATAIAIWWLIALCSGLGLWPRLVRSSGMWLSGSLLGGFVLFTLLSMAWASDLAAAFAEFDRAALYFGVFLLTALTGARALRARWADGLAIGIGVIGAIALLSRLFPDLFPTQGLPEFLPSAENRLSFPIGYWNGLGIFLAFAVPLLLRVAVVGRQVGRALAIGALPPVVAAIYLSSSRGAVLAALVGAAVLVALPGPRWRLFAAALTAGVGSVATCAFVAHEHALVDGPLDSGSAASQGRVTFAVVLALSGLTAAAWFFGARVRLEPPRWAGQAVVGIVIATVVVVIGASDPSQRFSDFKQPPALTGTKASVSTHLFSSAGNGRWQFWGAAWHQFESAPVVGRGAGSYAGWWAEHASFPYFVLNAHSLYLEVLGELGIIGFVLLVGAFVTGFVVGIKRLRGCRADERITFGALIALLAAFCVAAGVEWIWQLTAVGAVGVVALGLLVSPAVSETGPHAVSEPSVRRRPPLPLGVASVVVAWLVICAQAVPWLSDVKVRMSQSAAARGDGGAALREAESGRAIEPWASTPYLQLALVAERIGDLPAARRWLSEAIDRDSEDWRLWLVRARLETKAGRTGAATGALERAIELNPKSPLFADLRG